MPIFGEVFVSDILKMPVLDPVGNELGRIKDLSIIKGEPLPKIETLIIEKKKRFYQVSWSHVSIFNKRIVSTDLKAADLIDYDFPDDDMLAQRDLLDKQIVDANGVKVVRANDIKLEGYEGEAVLVAVDVGVRGILRRLGVERNSEKLLKLIGTQIPYNLISWNYLQPLQSKLSEIALNIPSQMMADLHPADLADLISQVSPDEGVQFIENLDAETAADAISELEPETQAAMINDMSVELAADIIEEMSPDSAADILGQLSPEKAHQILEQVEKEGAEDIQELLGHEADTAGGLMTNAYLAYPPELTVREVIERFRQDAPQMEGVYYLYAIDEDERLLGVVSLGEILLASPDDMLLDIMETNLKTVGPEKDEMETAATISKYGLVALPVVDSEDHLLGIVTLDVIIDRLMPSRRTRRGV